jgi:hypothetical protein
MQGLERLVVLLLLLQLTAGQLLSAEIGIHSGQYEQLQSRV